MFARVKTLTSVELGGVLVTFTHFSIKEKKKKAYFLNRSMEVSGALQEGETSANVFASPHLGRIAPCMLRARLNARLMTRGPCYLILLFSGHNERTPKD